MPITDPSHTFHSASSSGHHVTEEDVIEEDEEDEIDSQDDIDDNANMDEGDDEPLFDIARAYRQLSITCKSDAKAICGSLTLLQMHVPDST
ncbi:hypothetical protein Taro_056359 [Colocasia esculenta]|uniref:Uncharacterized protein n=1 Tax=Colocasia esculenta TaxID=4460 RepID=A0A843XVY6_COLES|nr:hypothetical protein [Colocasia esculenta]